MTVLLDVNVILSLLGRCGPVLQTVNDLWVSGRFDVVLSEELFAELSESISTPKLHQLHGLSAERVARFLERVRARVRIEGVVCRREYPGLRDPDDAAVLAAAEFFRPDFIVTGDKDLLVLREFEGIPILTPRQFIELF